MSEPEYTIIPGFRATSKLMLVPSEQQIYKCKYTHKDYKYYVCYNKQCRSNLFLNVDSNKISRKAGKDHNHGTQADLIEKLKLINEIKSNCEKASTTQNSLRDIFNETCEHFGKNSASSSVQFGRMKRNLMNIKNRKSIPKYEPQKKPGPKVKNSPMQEAVSPMDRLPDTTRDEYTVFAEYIANKIRNCNRSQLEKSLAQHTIHTALLNLEMGKFAEQIPSQQPLVLIHASSASSVDRTEVSIDDCDISHVKCES